MHMCHDTPISSKFQNLVWGVLGPAGIKLFKNLKLMNQHFYKMKLINELMKTADYAHFFLETT